MLSKNNIAHYAKMSSFLFIYILSLSANASGSNTENINQNSNNMSVMSGIPVWMGIAGMATIIIASHFFVGKTESYKKRFTFNLLNFKPLKFFVLKNWFPLFIQSVSIFMFILIVSAGIWGNQRVNIAPILTWTWWWALLIFFILCTGELFCTICPWEGFSSMISSFSLTSRKKKNGFEFKWPKKLQNIYPALIFFIVLTWFELGMNITKSPSMTAIMALVMLGIAVICALVFEKRMFCRHICLVGRISGIYSMFSPVEIRSQNKDICRTCTGKECYAGSAKTAPCPTNLFPGHLQENTYCTMCTECIRSCPHDNMAINIRPFAEDLKHKSTFKIDESILAVVLLALTSFHGLTMTPLWYKINNLIRVETSLGETFVFTLLMSIMIIIPVLLFWFAAKSAKILSQTQSISTGKIFKIFGYSVIPIALFYHLAHNGMHFFMEAQHLIPVLSDPFGQGWNLFGTAKKTYNPILSLQTIWWLQIILIIIGHIYGVVIADKLAMKIFKDKKQAFRSLVPLILTMILYSGFSIWLIAQPMEMRSGM